MDILPGKNRSVPRNLQRKYLGVTALIIVTILWGATFVIVKESLNDVSSMLFIALRFSIAAIFLIPIYFKNRDKFKKPAVIAGTILGLFLFFGFATQTVGLKYTTATKSGFLTGTLVVMVPIFQTIIEKRAPTKGAVIGTILVFIGILFLSSGGDSIFTFLDDLGSNFNVGDFLTLLCAVFFALYVVYLDIVSPKFDFWILLSLQIFTTAILGYISSILFFAVSFEPIRIDLTQYLIFGLVYTALFATLITTALQTKFQKEVSPTKAGIIYSFEPIFAALFAFFLLSEKITNFGFVGSVLIFSGLIVSELHENLLKKNGTK